MLFPVDGNKNECEMLLEWFLTNKLNRDKFEMPKTARE